MLKRISVENYVLIERLDIEFGRSLNIITGETGAGKSILLGAIGLLAGNRADVGSLLDAGRNCVIEGLYDIGNYGLEDYFKDNDLEYEDLTTVRRVIAPSGKSRCYINDLPVTIQVLKEFGTRTIDIHSQHQTLLLSDERFRFSILDAGAGHAGTVSQYRQIYEELKRVQARLNRAAAARDESAREQEWLRFQLTELREARLSAGEQALLESELAELSHTEEIREVLGSALGDLSAEETGILARLKSVENGLRRIQRFFSGADGYLSRIRSLAEEAKDIERELSDKVERIESDPERLDRISQRLDLLYSLQQKYKVSSEQELLDELRGLESRLEEDTRNDELIAGLRRQVAELEERAAEIAGKISQARKKTSVQISKFVQKSLTELGMSGTRFEPVVTDSASLNGYGRDQVSFMFSANADLPLQPVENTASGGELSRLMLCLKSFGAINGNLPTIIFDEIDSGVSGKVADAMGNIIEKLSGNIQVINITHLPQVACKGPDHFIVSKSSDAGSTRTTIRPLSPSERVTEIAKMLSGNEVTEAAIEQARLLLGTADR